MRNPRFLLDQAREAVAWCREASTAPIVLGGAGFSILPQPILNYLDADMGIQGEGETIFPELLRRLDAGEAARQLCPGSSQGEDSARCAAHLPRTWMRCHCRIHRCYRDHLSGARDAPVPVQTRRGCPMSCSYCSTPTIEGKLVRWRSPESVVAWITRWVEEGFRNFYFVDNTFNLPPSYATQLCSKIIAAGLNISWRCILFPGGLTPNLIEMLAKAGCTEVSLGFESGSERMLHRMNKQFQSGEVRRASEMLRRHSIRRMGFLLLGGPGETKESAEESLAFAESLELDILRMSVGIRIYPHTDLSRAAMEEGLISSEEDLLFPRFYMAKGIEDWLFAEVNRRMASRPNWIF